MHSPSALNAAPRRNPTVRVAEAVAAVAASLTLLLSIGCAGVRAQRPDPAGPGTPHAFAYLGQTPPADSAIPFGVGVMGRDGYFAAERVAISRDGREIYFSELKGYAPGAPMRIRVVRYRAGQWQEPETIADSMSSPAFALDGRLIAQDMAGEGVLSSDPAGGASSFRRFLGRPVRTHYLAQTRRGWYASSPSVAGRSDLDFSRVVTAGADTTFASLGDPLNTTHNDADFYIPPDESYFLFASPNRGGYGSGDLFISFPRSGGGWTGPVNLGPAVNGAGWEWGPMVTADGRYLLFTRQVNASDRGPDLIYWIRIDGIIARLRRTAGGRPTAGPEPGGTLGVGAGGPLPAATDLTPASVVGADPTAAEMADSVRAAFLHAWEGYRQFAWGHDELKPLSRSAHDWYGAPVLMTPVDGYDTMLLMGLDSAAEQAAGLIRTRLTFDRDTSVQVFEVTIRLVGGLLSGYEMNGDTAFLRLARDLADRLMPAFRSPTGMPYRYVNLHTGRTGGPVSNPAEIGTLMLEFGTLTRLTGDSTYYRAAKRAITRVFEHRSHIGLVGSGIDVRTGAWTNPDASLSAYIDSYYEYLLKSWLLFGDPDFKRMWDASFGPVRRYLLDRRADGLWAGHAHMRTGARTATHFGALDAFVPGLLVLAGDTADAAGLMQSVDRMWQAFDLEPEVMDYARMSIVDPFYPLRPEAIESAYYLWHYTRDPRYRAMGWDMFRRLQRWARTDPGYASIKDVRTKEHADEMPSFLLAETFKYAYLLFAPDSTLRLDEVVFNTEAHPLRRRPGSERGH